MKNSLPKILFVLKYRQHYGDGYSLKESGLLNSAQFVCDMLKKEQFPANLVQVVDNNEIDKVVTANRPDIVIIEALWVVPEKFAILQKLHPNVKWIIRLHSEIPFLANEGIAFNWIPKYLEHKNVFLSANSYNTHKDLLKYTTTINPEFVKKLVFLPNYYPVNNRTTPAELFWDKGEVIDVGCFGAIRPLKNQLIQAVAAVQFAEEKGLTCRFHINASRIEGKGDNVLKNIRSFFESLNGKHELVEHPWMARKEFLEVVRQMDIGLQMSFSETFNIVSADFVTEDIPIVTSNEVDWMPWFFTANPTDTRSIVHAMNRVLFYDRHFIWLDWQRLALRKYVNKSKDIWTHNLTNI